jgi:hypothetical protein
MEITRSSVEGASAKGAAEWFTGDVYIDIALVAQLCWLLIIPIRVAARRWAANSGAGSVG